MKVVFIVFCIFVMTVFNRLQAEDSAKVDSLKTGSEAPVFSLPDAENNYVFLRDLCGKKLRKPWIKKEKQVVVLSFFATWCAPCQKEIPYLMQIQEQYKSQNVKVFLVDVGESRGKALPFIKKRGFTLPVLLDQYQIVAKKYGAHSLPRLVVIDKNGIVQKYKRGFEDGEAFLKEMNQLLDKLIAR